MIQKRNLKNHLRDLSFKMTVDTEKYLEFVKGVTSAPSLDYAMMATRFAELEANGTNTIRWLYHLFNVSTIFSSNIETLCL